MPTLRQISRLPNMNDANAAQIARVRVAAERVVQTLSLRGYSQIETPLLEETELFLRKSGGELSSRLYDFEEPGGFRTSLRPEFTSPVIRYAIENGEAGSRVCRYQYFGPVFRYATPEHLDGAKTRQFNQLGAELIGSPAPRADGEVIAMTVEGLAALDVPPVTIALGHVGMLRQLLRKFQLSDRASEFLLSNAVLIAGGRVNDVRESAARLGFLGVEKKSVADAPGRREQIEAVLDRSLGQLGANAGSRTREEVIARLARKQTYADDPERFESALSMFGELMSISGSPASALAEGRKLATGSGLDEKCFMLLERVVAAATDQGVPESKINIRYGLARGVAYYTGMVFDILRQPDATDSMGGGGRYDGLTRALGLKADIPALGFAYTFDTVVDAMPTGKADNIATYVLVRPADEDAWQAAAKAAVELRKEGRAAILDSETDYPAAEISEVITVDAAGHRTAGSPGAGK